MDTSAHLVYGQSWGLCVARCYSIEGDPLDEGEGLQLLPIPESFICPLSMDAMQDPVVLGDGCAYERQYIDDWIKRRKQQRLPATSPSTGLEMASPLRMVSLVALGKAVEVYLSHRPEFKAECSARRSFEQMARALQSDLDEKEAVHGSVRDELQRLTAQVNDLTGTQRANEELLQDICGLHAELEQEREASVQIRREVAAYREAARSLQEEVCRLRPKADEVESLREENEVFCKELGDARAMCAMLKDLPGRDGLSPTADAFGAKTGASRGVSIGAPSAADLAGDSCRALGEVDSGDDHSASTDGGLSGWHVNLLPQVHSQSVSLHQHKQEEPVEEKLHGQLLRNPKIEEEKFEQGEVVEIINLKARPELNGTHGTLICYDQEVGRWQFRSLVSGTCFKIRPDNIQQAPMSSFEVATAAMHGRPFNADVQRDGCKAVHLLAMDLKNQFRIAGKGGIEVMVAAMNGHPGDVCVQRYGCMALGNLAARNQVRIVEDGGIEVIVAAMNGHPDDVCVQTAGCSGLGDVVAGRHRSHCCCHERPPERCWCPATWL